MAAITVTVTRTETRYDGSTTATSANVSIPLGAPATPALAALSAGACTPGAVAGGTCTPGAVAVAGGFPAPGHLTPADFDVIFFDCDDCLYFNDWATANLITEAIEGYCTKTLGLPDGEAYALYKRHGTAIKGLILENILAKDKIEDFLLKVHDVDHARDINPDKALREMLGNVKPRRWVFTASTRQHATRCMECLGVADMFAEIVDTRDCKLETKYAVSSFEAAMKKAGVTDPKRCMLLDDSVGNIKTAAKVGFYAVLVGSEMRDGSGKKDCPEADVVLESIHDMPKVMPGLF